MTDKIVVFSTCATPEEARTIARNLVEARLAACVNIVPGVRSVYRWKGTVDEADECMLVIKSSRSLFDRLRIELEKAHTYEVPEAIAVAVVAGAPNFLDWVDKSVDSAAV
jgi:periplasmic divalent cation tolerance protein